MGQDKQRVQKHYHYKSTLGCREEMYGVLQTQIVKSVQNKDRVLMGLQLFRHLVEVSFG